MAKAARRTSGQRKARPKPRSDQLDGCEVDMTVDAVRDDELLFVVFGEDKAKFAEYRRLLRRKAK